jgi:hypothetical protein
MTTSSLPSLLQRFFTERLITQQGASPHTVAGYRDTFRLLFRFTTQQLHRAPSALRVEDLDTPFLERFLEHLERDRFAVRRSYGKRVLCHSIGRNTCGSQCHSRRTGASTPHRTIGHSGDSSFGRQAVPIAVNRVNEPRLMRVGFNLLSQAGNGMIYRSRHWLVGVHPKLTEELGPRDNMPLPFRQISKHLELSVSQVNDLVRRGGPQGAKIHGYEPKP